MTFADKWKMEPELCDAATSAEADSRPKKRLGYVALQAETGDAIEPGERTVILGKKENER